jgi:nitrate reductase gamma subunit
METFLDFARGPLFRLTFAIMILGLLRILILDIWAAGEAYRRAGDKTLPWPMIIRRTAQWFFPIKRVGTNRPVYSILSMLFHIGLIAVPIFLAAHVRLWSEALGFGWVTLPKVWADWMTLVTIAAALLLFLGRIASHASNYISRKQDYLWPLLLLLPFATGYFCANVSMEPAMYNLLMLMHILSAELIFVLMPFTKIAHCILMPLSQFISNLAWKFPANTDEDVCTTLNKKGAPV